MSLMIAVYVSSPSAGKLEMCIAGICRGGCIFLTVCVMRWLYLSDGVRDVVVVSFWWCAWCGGCIFLTVCVMWWLYLSDAVCDVVVVSF